MSTREALVALDRHSESYAAGVEIGMLYQHLAREALPLTTIVHARNGEMLASLATAFGAEAHVDEVDDRWLSVTFARATDEGRGAICR